MALSQCLEKQPGKRRELVEQYYQAGTIRAFADARGIGFEALYKILQRVQAALRDCIAAWLAQEASS